MVPIQGVLAGQEEYSSVYIDDILIFSHSWEEHVIHVRAVLVALRQHCLLQSLVNVFGVPRH